MSNVRSLINKLDYFNHFITECSPNTIYAFTESWLHDCILSSNLLVNSNLAVFRQDRAKRGGGVVLFVPNMYNATLCTEFTVSSSTFDAVSITIKSKNGVILLCCVYRPPSAVVAEDFIHFTNQLSSYNNGATFIFGDFNLPEYNWADFPTAATTKSYAPFCNVLIDGGFTQFVKSPTHFSRTSNNFLDLFFTNDPSYVVDCCVTDEFGDESHRSDHKTVCTKLAVDFTCSNTDNSNTTRYNWAKADWVSITAYFDALSWPDLFENCRNDVNEFWVVFMYHFNFARSNFVPIVRGGKRHAVFSARTRNLYRRYSRLRAKLAKQCTNNTNNCVLKSCVKYVFRMYRKSRRFDLGVYESDMLNGHNYRTFWRFVSSRVRGKSSKPSPFNDSNGNLCSTDDSMCSAFGNFFSSVFESKYAGGDCSELKFDSVPNNHNINFTSASVENALRSCKSDFCAGADNIPNIFLKKLSSVISSPLATIFNISYSTGVVPKEWVSARVKPVPKPASPGSVNDFRPISITSNVGKLMESLISADMTSFLNANNFFSPFQFGFLPKRAVDTQLLSCLNEWTSFLNDKLPVDVIYLDVRKAFDTLCHYLLLQKLIDIGFSRSLINWIRGWLCFRMQHVKIGNSCSESVPVTSGVPQGSILGPLLFIIFVNDLPSVVQHSSIRMFADDVKLYRPVSSCYDMRLLLHDLIAVFAWFHKNRLSLALNKSAVLHLYSRANQNFTYAINGTEIRSVTSMRDLGVIIDADLTFVPHINSIVQKANVRSGILLRAFRNNDIHFLTRMYKVFVRPLLESACSVWSPQLIQQNNLLNLLEGVQRKFTRYASQDYNSNTAYLDRCRLFQLQPLCERRLFLDLCLAYRIINNLAVVPCSNLLPAGTSVPRRHKQQLATIFSRVNVRYNFFSARIPRVYNFLSADTVSCTTLTSFRSTLISDRTFVSWANNFARRLHLPA